MTNFALIDPDKTHPLITHDPDKTAPPMPRISFQDLMDRMDEAIIRPGLAAEFAEELLDQLDHPELWSANNYLKLDARPYETGNLSERKP